MRAATSSASKLPSQARYRRLCRGGEGSALGRSKDVAAVLACAALEDALKRFGRLKGLQVEDKAMQEVVNAP